MSEPAPESPAQVPAKSGGKLGVWAKKIGPLPMWAWVALLLGLVLVYLYRKNQTSANTSDTTAADSTDASQVPQFVNQVNTTVTPPAAPTTPTSTSTGTAAPYTVYRETAPGGQSLAQIAKARGTTVQHLISTTKSAQVSGGISADNLAKFLAYVASGTNKPMPKGLVFYSSNPPKASQERGVSVP